MSINITKHDIGAEVLSILTKGMYPEPCDAIREYVQNGIDAGARNIEIKIRTNTVVIEDDGSGMDEATLKKSIRIGISDKNPKVDVGFRGIGIYSAFHLCDYLYIFSRADKNKPYHLIFNFKKMRDKLQEQQYLRLNGKLSGDQLVDLQSLLEKHIDLKELESDKFPRNGTRVELVNLDANFIKSLTNYEEVSSYLRQVVPLHFDPQRFRWSKVIESRIADICKANHAEFHLINLTLQVGTRIEQLYRPYTDDSFKGEPKEPKFEEVKRANTFFGVAWGCLNPKRKKIEDKELRGFLITKQGFAIGKRINVSKYFGRTTFFDRFIGEIIVVHHELLPNAPRTDFEMSPLRAQFYEALVDVANKYNENANKFQEFTKGDDLLNESVNRLKKIETELSYHSGNPDKLVDIIVEVRGIHNQIDGRIKRKALEESRMIEAKEVLKTSKELEKDIQNFIRKAKKAKKIPDKGEVPELKSIKRIKKLPETKSKDVNGNPPSRLIEVLEQLDIPISEQQKVVYEFIDERFIQSLAANKAQYLQILQNMKKEIEDILAEE